MRLFKSGSRKYNIRAKGRGDLRQGSLKRFLREGGIPPGGGLSAQSILNAVNYTGLQPPGDMIETIDCFEEKFSVRTSLNIYHGYLRPGTLPGELERFMPQASGVALITKRVTGQWGAKQLPMNCVNKQYSSATMAVLYYGSVTPCARSGLLRLRTFI